MVLWSVSEKWEGGDKEKGGVELKTTLFLPLQSKSQVDVPMRLFLIFL